MKTFVDVHTHLFTVRDISMGTLFKRFGWMLQMALKWPLSKTPIGKRAQAFERAPQLEPVALAEMYLDELTYFVRTHFKDCERIVCCPQLIYFSKEEPTKQMSIQLAEMANIKQIREHNGFEIVWVPFIGRDLDHAAIPPMCDKKPIKIYPPLNVDILSDAWIPVFRNAEKNGVPILAHCSDGGLVSMNISKSRARELANPNRWLAILQKFPNLKVCLAHYGTNSPAWDSTMRMLAASFPNVYLDISYSYLDADQCAAEMKLIWQRGIEHKIIFGTDFFMNKSEKIDLPSAIEPFYKALSEKKDFLDANNESISYFDQMSKNGLRFLGMTE